jgi:hypothetical protein
VSDLQVAKVAKTFGIFDAMTQSIRRNSWRVSLRLETLFQMYTAMTAKGDANE